MSAKAKTKPVQQAILSVDYLQILCPSVKDATTLMGLLSKCSRVEHEFSPTHEITGLKRSAMDLNIKVVYITREEGK